MAVKHQKTLDATKTGMEVFESGKKLLDKDTPGQGEHPSDSEWARAVADMLRSYVPYAFAELLFYIARATAPLILLSWTLDFLTRREAKRIAKDMQHE